jgi:hypothetical protein
MHVAPMLAVDARGNAGECRHRQEFEGREISRVDNCRPQLAEHSPQPEMGAKFHSFPLVKRNHRNVGSENPIPKLRKIRQANDGVTIAILRHVVD